MPNARPDLRDRIRGVLLGTALGDAFAYPFEGTPIGGLPGLELALDRRAASPSYWGYSDDTEMMLGVAESIVERGVVDPRHLLERFALNYEPARGYGKGMKLAIDALMRGRDWRVVAQSAWPGGSKGNGAAVRVGPVACLHHGNLETLRTTIIAATAVTHAHPDAISGALLVGHAVAASIHHEASMPFDRPAFLDALHRVEYPAGTWVHRALDDIGRLLEAKASRIDIVGSLGHGRLASESVPAALYCFLRYAPDFGEAVTQAARLGGDTDTIAGMAGAMAGALVGASGIPEGWKESLERGGRGYDFILQVADELTRTSSEAG